MSNQRRKPIVQPKDFSKPKVYDIVKPFSVMREITQYHFLVTPGHLVITFPKKEGTSLVFENPKFVQSIFSVNEIGFQMGHEIVTSSSETLSPFFVLPLKTENPFVLILGTPGHGKSTLLKLALYSFFSLGFMLKTVIIDPDGEYMKIITKLRNYIPDLKVKEVVIQGGKTVPNIFEIPGFDPKEHDPLSIEQWIKDVLVPSLFEILGIEPKVAVNMTSLLLTALRNTYIQSSDLKNYINSPTENFLTIENYKKIKTYPTLVDLYQQLKALSDTIAKDRGSDEVLQSIRTLMIRVDSRRKENEPASIIDGEEKINLFEEFNTNDILIINIRSIQGMDRDRLLYYLGTYFLRYILQTKLQEMARTQTKYLLVIDEAHVLFKGDNDQNSNTGNKNRFEEIIQRGRKRGAVVFLSTQNPSDVPKRIIDEVSTVILGSLGNRKLATDLLTQKGIPQPLLNELIQPVENKGIWLVLSKVTDPSVPFKSEPVLITTSHMLKEFSENIIIFKVPVIDSPFA